MSRCIVSLTRYIAIGDHRGWPGPARGRFRADRTLRVRDYLAEVRAEDFTRPVDVLENGTNPLQECLFTVFEEEFWHNRYAQRDLARLEAATSSEAGMTTQSGPVQPE